MTKIISEEKMAVNITVAVCSRAEPITYSYSKKMGKLEVYIIFQEVVYILWQLMPLLPITGLMVMYSVSQHVVHQ